MNLRANSDKIVFKKSRKLYAVVLTFSVSFILSRVVRGNLGIVDIKRNYEKLELSQFLLTCTIIMSNNKGMTYEMFLVPGNYD